MKEVWYIRGEAVDGLRHMLFATKMAAEIYARELFPNEPPDTRYARVYCMPVWEESDMTGAKK